ncbi:LamB/YcsF family protein [Corynebacterium epidermidicanis]|uniref:5-oxoprolinase subunit A n=1 Tax=Corynebacterium epidermidicanis TaxID=1050174 RepID=A0A0G3GQD0_9CORY|nr:5-oxoprolinase subunit PxpA [Corynebacterium epidermidicanis]AKK02765.1 putative lactam utilization protein B-like protein [Corynebacterium epidermidicanis]
MSFIDLNCDLGESFGNYTIGNDEAMLDLVSSANIACGFHAGDASVMDTTVAAAVERGVRIGAHVGYRDLAGFGRRAMAYAPEELRAETTYQIGALQAFARKHGSAVQYVKPHGALYNTIAHDEAQAQAVIQGIKDADPNLALMGLAGAPVLEWAANAGLKVLSETFADRAYTAEGTLVPRSQEGAVHHDPEVAAAQAIAFATQSPITSVTGSPIMVHADSICVHGDNPAALALVKQIISELNAREIEVRHAD